MTIGQRLKRARANKSLSFEEIHKATKIQPSVLIALEEDRTDQILSPIYARNFVKEYANFLGMDVPSIMQEYDAQGKAVPEPELIVGEQKKIIKNKKPFKVRFSFKKQYFIYVVSGLLVIIVMIGMVKLVGFIGSKLKANQEVSSKMPEALVPLVEELELTIKVTDETWVKIEADGQRVFENIIRSHGSETWKANNSFKAWVGNAGNVKFILNGNDLGSPGRGVIKNIVIDREGMRVP